ncbi:hypothetical protein AB0G77_38055 [Streptomyces hygroscopicus]|uniref:hypothetical protein n=1 Tax=Streptomyces hygroscopicus TaxID=1912 RepID=UPI0033C732CB
MKVRNNDSKFWKASSPTPSSSAGTTTGATSSPLERAPAPVLMPGLERWSGYKQFVQVHARWAICEEADVHAAYLDAQPQLSDHEAGELHEAIDAATGVTDAAYAYGQLAESTLRFALLEPRAQHARQQSAR